MPARHMTGDSGLSAEAAAILVDKPEEWKKTVDAFAKRKKAAEKAEADAKDALDALANKEAELTALAEQLERDKADHAANVTDDEAAFEERDKKTRAAEKKAIEDADSNQARADELDTRENGLNEREAQLNFTASEQERRKERQDEREAKLDTRDANLKAQAESLRAWRENTAKVLNGLPSL